MTIPGGRDRASGGARRGGRAAAALRWAGSAVARWRSEPATAQPIPPAAGAGRRGGRAEGLAALRALPAERASPDFTARVLARLRAGDGRRRRTLRVRWAVAAGAAAGLAAVAVLAIWVSRQVAERRAGRLRAEVRQMRTEVIRLQEELRALQEPASRLAPVLYLGGDERLDLVLDLRPWAEELAARPAATPAAAGSQEAGGRRVETVPARGEGS